MMFFILLNIMIFMSTIFVLFSHPLLLGLILIIQTLLISMFMGFISQSFWFSYILFLVIIGGMLILFIYVITLIYNKLFFQNIFNNLMISCLFTFFILIFNFKIYMKNNDMLMYTTNNDISLNLIKLYNYPMNMLNIFMIIYLFFLLIVVVKITYFFTGPLRMKIN